MAQHSPIRRFAKNNLLMTLVSGAAAVLSANESVCGQSIHWPRQDLAIPFELSSIGTPPAQLVLEVSEDAGKTWQSVAKADPKAASVAGSNSQLESKARILLVQEQAKETGRQCP